MGCSARLTSGVRTGLHRERHQAQTPEEPGSLSSRRACPWLVEQILLVDPKLIVPLGNVAMRRFRGAKDKIGDVRGSASCVRAEGSSRRTTRPMSGASRRRGRITRRIWGDPGDAERSNRRHRAALLKQRATAWLWSASSSRKDEGTRRVRSSLRASPTSRVPQMRPSSGGTLNSSTPTSTFSVRLPPGPCVSLPVVIQGVRLALRAQARAAWTLGGSPSCLA